MRKTIILFVDIWLADTELLKLAANYQHFVKCQSLFISININDHCVGWKSLLKVHYIYGHTLLNINLFKSHIWLHFHQHLQGNELEMPLLPINLTNSIVHICQFSSVFLEILGSKRMLLFCCDVLGEMLCSVPLRKHCKNLRLNSVKNYV